MITKNRILFVLGLATVLVPFLGFPSSYEMFFSIIFGLATLVLAFLYARDKRLVEVKDPLSKEEVATEVYVESQPQNEFSSQLRSRPIMSRNIKTPVN